MKGRRTLINFASVESHAKELERFRRELERSLDRAWKARAEARKIIDLFEGRPDVFADETVNPREIEARYHEALDRIESYTAFLDTIPALLEALVLELSALRTWKLNAEGFPVLEGVSTEQPYYVVSTRESVRGPFLRGREETPGEIKEAHPRSARIAWFDSFSETLFFSELSPIEAWNELDPPDQRERKRIQEAYDRDHVKGRREKAPDF